MGSLKLDWLPYNVGRVDGASTPSLPAPCACFLCDALFLEVANAFIPMYLVSPSHYYRRSYQRGESRAPWTRRGKWVHDVHFGTRWHTTSQYNSARSPPHGGIRATTRRTRRALRIARAESPKHIMNKRSTLSSGTPY
jgi:hypothetical protein